MIGQVIKPSQSELAVSVRANEVTQGDPPAQLPFRNHGGVSTNLLIDDFTVQATIFLFSGLCHEILQEFDSPLKIWKLEIME